jgi:hypothetical protein
MFFAPKVHQAWCGLRIGIQDVESGPLLDLSRRRERRGAGGGGCSRAGALATISLPRRVVSAAGEDRSVYRQVGSVSSYVEGNLDLVRCGHAGSRVRT